MRDKDNPFWEVHDVRRTSRYWSKIYADQSQNLSSRIFWKDCIIALFASTSAISAFPFLTGSFYGSKVWVAGVFAAAILATIGPILKWIERFEHYNSMLAGYRDLESACEVIIFSAQQTKSFNDYALKRFEEVMGVKAALRAKGKPLPLSYKEKQTYQNDVNAELPPDSLYLPPR